MSQWVRSEPYMIYVAWKSEHGPTNGIDTSYYTMEMNPSIELKSLDYCFLLLKLETYYSFPNIKPTNNSFKYCSQKLREWKTTTPPTGAYNTFDINIFVNAETDKKRRRTKNNLS